MRSSRRAPPILARRTLATALLAAAELLAVPAHAQEDAEQAAPDVAELEASAEAAWANALAQDDSEPLFVFSAWSAVMMSEIMLDRARALASGVDPPHTSSAVERALARWRRLRPGDAGPELYPLFQIEDPAEKARQLLEVYSRFPDDGLALYHVAEGLRQAGDDRRAGEILEGFVERNPERAVGFRLLAQHHGAQNNESRTAEVLRRWAGVAPSDPQLVERWLRSPLPRQDPVATDRLLHAFFATRPSIAALMPCSAVARDAVSSHREAARACLARIAADPEADWAAIEASAVLVEMAAAEGDWAGLTAALHDLPADQRARAAYGAARQLEAPERCDERVELLRATWSAISGREEPAGGPGGLVASALSPCSSRPPARDLFLELVRTSPTDGVMRVIGGWAQKVNGVWRGELPAEAVAPILERRLAEEPDAERLLEALDVVYQVGEMDEKRYRLLRDWQRRRPESFQGERAIDLADELFARDELDEAARVLERQMEWRFEPELADTLWELLVEGGAPARADALAEQLLASGEPLRVATGHLLAARAAVFREDFAAAEEHYRASLGGERYREDAAVELLALLAWQGQTAGLAETAREICESRTAADDVALARCATRLLGMAGHGEAGSALLPERARDLPDSVRELEELAQTAYAAERWELVEQARRRIIEIDPLNAQAWGNLASFLRTRKSYEQLETLLVDVRRTLTTPPGELLRVIAEARLASHRPREAIDLLREARGLMPPGADTSWIDAEIREAYVALARTLPTRPAAAAPAVARRGTTPVGAPPADPGPESSPHELLSRAEALQAGTDGRYDPLAARDLFERAAAGGDPVATFRLALILQISRSAELRDPERASALHRRVRRRVEALAADGDPYAQYLVGTAALSGLGVPEDHRLARRWLERAAAGDVSWAWHNLGWMQWTGRGFDESDRPRAIESYRRAAELGNAVSMYDFARMALTAYGSKPLCEEGRRRLERSAGTGNAEAGAYLGKVLLYGLEECVAPDPAAARPWLEAASPTGERGASYDLGLALLTAEGEARDPDRAVLLLERSAGEADPLAYETLAWMYATGTGVPRDPAKARALIDEAARVGSDGFPRLAAQAARFPVVADLYATGVERLEALTKGGDAFAAALLADLLYNGSGVPAEPERALALARTAAAAGEAGAVRTLAHAHRHGNGVPRDEAEAVRLWRRCAQVGDSFCMMFYAHALLRGELVDQDLAGGLAWLTSSAEVGNWWAVGDLGRLHDEGWHGLPPDEARSAHWRRIAARAGNAEARGWLLYHGHPVD